LINNNNYINIRSKLPITCPTHGKFYQRGYDHNRGHGCKKCGRISCSKKSLTWIDNIMLRENIYIQHAGNGGEFRIPTTQMSADGYHKETNTIYEFDGDAYHGNPYRYKPTDKCHPYDKDKNALELYEQTIEKQNRLKQLGYILISIWESDFDKLNLPVINNYSDLVVSKVDSTYPDKLIDIGLQIVGEYTDSKQVHTLLCLRCGDTHVATPISKMWCHKRHPTNYGCPTCNKKLTDSKNKTRGNYVNRLSELNYIAYDYKNAGIKCLLECIVCGKQKTVTPSAIIQRNKPCCEVI
jgi:hypothetical protein